MISQQIKKKVSPAVLERAGEGKKVKQPQEECKFPEEKGAHKCHLFYVNEYFNWTLKRTTVILHI